MNTGLGLAIPIPDQPIQRLGGGNDFIGETDCDLERYQASGFSSA
jgi:hypothetical protein